MGTTRRRKQPTEGWATKVLVKLTREDLGVLNEVGEAGEPLAHIYLRAAESLVVPKNIILRYRKAPLFPGWMTQGPLDPVTADMRSQRMIRSGFEVEAVEVPPLQPKPKWPEDLEPEEDAPTCDECGAELEDGECPDKGDH